MEKVLIQRDGRVWGADRRTLYGRISQANREWLASCAQCDADIIGRRRVDVVGELAEHWKHSDEADSGSGVES